MATWTNKSKVSGTSWTNKSVNNTTYSGTGYLAKEANGLILKEDGFRIVLEQEISPAFFKKNVTPNWTNLAKN